MKVSRHSSLRLPDSLRQTLLMFRRRLWAVKLFEAIALAAIAVLIGFLLTFFLDRLHDTSPLVRACILMVVLVVCLAVPLAMDRWILRRRRLDQLARLLAVTRPSIGDQLLGVIELADDQSEQSRSPELVNAAIRQVDQQVSSEDFRNAIPDPRYRRRGIAACGLGLIAVALFIATAPAARNAWARLLAPWKQIPRYTFTAIQPLPESMIVAQDEPFEIAVRLAQDSQWFPSTAVASLSGQGKLHSKLDNDQYRFDLPGQLSPDSLAFRVGDFRGQVIVEPKSRPELRSLVADFQLPGYLGRTKPVTKDVRGSTVSVVKGSQALLTATVSRDLLSATVNGIDRDIVRNQFHSESFLIDQPTPVELSWRDSYGLSGKQPYSLLVEPVDDQAPTVMSPNLPRRKVLLDSEVLAFQVHAADDFGVKRVGIQWQAVDGESVKPEAGEMIIGAGGVDAESLELAATFSAFAQRISSQTISLRLFAEDYLPGRPRSYSPESIFDVLSANQHAIWITSQLSRWQQTSLDARDRELQLHQVNKELRAMTDQQLQLPENQKRLSRQAELERSGGNQLASLVRNGENLLQEAMRNPEIGVGHLDKWAEMIKTLKEIADHRMPSVAELLQQAANDATAAAAMDKSRQAGQNRLMQQSSAGEQPSPDGDQSASPSISDVESSHNDLTSQNSDGPSESKSKQSQLTLPSTMLASPAKPKSNSEASIKQEIAEAVKVQQDLLAEFDKIADELNEVLANLEGSTIVKRLKASSRQQQQVASKLASLAADTFGVSERMKQQDVDAFQELAATEMESSDRTSHIMDDMDAYFQRSRMLAFRNVLDQMRESDVTAELRLLSDELRKENGLSISQAEYWSDTFDRWAEDLVGVCESGECPGGKSKGSLPPSVVLEVLKLLEAEVMLREQTRVAEQARPAVSHTQHIETADGLWQTQDELQQRTESVVDRIRNLPEGESDFAKEIGMLTDVSRIMIETVEILRRPDTGPAAIAAETEIIEKLLESKRFSPSGGGGGAAPGGGGNGETETPALALVGTGVNAKEMREELQTRPSTGVAGTTLPEEYRSGLDAYFNQLEAWRSGGK